MDKQTDFQTQFGNGITVASFADYQAQCAAAGIVAITTNKELSANQYSWEYAEYSDAAWQALGRNGRVAWVLGAALVRMLKNRPAKAAKPVTTPMVKCDCGHTVPQGQVMNASRGSSCPDCYDRMSN